MKKSHGLVGGVAIACLMLSTGCNSRADEEPAQADTAAQAPEPAAAEPAAPAVDVEYANFTGDPAAGEQVFAVCTTCHAVEEGVNKTGPSLHGIVGREAGTVEGYNYTEANANSGITWTPEQLFVYLADPQATIPGTKMVFPGVKDPQQRADLVAYLETL